MRAIDLFDCAYELGRLKAGCVVARAAGKPETLVNTIIVAAAGQCTAPIQALSTLAGVAASSWPPSTSAEFEAFFARLDRYGRTCGPDREAIWRIGTALAYCLWTPVPNQDEMRLQEALLSVGFSAEQSTKLIGELSSESEADRLRAIEVLRSNLIAADGSASSSATSVPIEVANELVYLRPNLFGIGLDINALIKRLLRRKT